MSDRLDQYETSLASNGKLVVQSPVGAFNQREVNPPSIENPIIVRGAWNLSALPNQIVAELQCGRLVMFFISPFRPLKESDFRPYKSYHPHKCKGQPLSDYLYRFYGLAKNEESATEVIHVRLTPAGKTAVENYGLNQEPSKTVSEVVREWIKTL